MYVTWHNAFYTHWCNTWAVEPINLLFDFLILFNISWIGMPSVIQTINASITQLLH